MQSFYKLGIFLLFFLSVPVYAQLPAFNLTVTPVDETCNGNGSLSFNVSNATPGATFTYSVYLQPDLNNPVRVTKANTVNSLKAGSYTVIAIESLDGKSYVVRKEDIVIANKITDLQFFITSTTRDCDDNGGEITVNVTAGTAVQYQIIGDPNRGLQSSNVFTGLTSGTYTIGVVDNCGNQKPLTYTLAVNDAVPTISQPQFENLSENDCETITIKNSISYPSGAVITYPITITYTIHPPDGAADIIVVKQFSSGLPNLLEFSNTFNDVDGSPYTYDISVTNGCGLTFGQDGMSVNPPMSVSAGKILVPCGRYYINVNVNYARPSYVVQLTSATNPAFNAADYNANYPKPFNDSSINFGSTTNPVPEGNYQISVTDACGRTKETEITIKYEELIPIVQAVNDGCFSSIGDFNISIPDLKIVSATIVFAPSDYLPGYPNDVTSLINAAGTLEVNNVPVGHYTVEVVDSCGTSYIVEVDIPGFSDREFVAVSVADCNVGLGAVKINSGNGKLVSMQMVSAPQGETVPIDVTEFIAVDGVLYLNNLPEGNYVFKGFDSCGLEKLVAVDVVGYHPLDGTSFSFSANCNSFSIDLFDNDTSSPSPSYWLQKENPNNPGTWMHPGTGVVYPEGTYPDGSNSLRISNGVLTPNLNYFGTFRIVKSFLSVGKGVAVKVCTEVLDMPFKYQFGATINNVYKLACSKADGTPAGNPNDVYVDATGLAPLTYFITHVDGVLLKDPISNGTSNTFRGLAAGEYIFEVRDACGTKTPLKVDLSILPDLVTANKPTDILKCIAEDESPNQEFDLTSLNGQILGSQSSSLYNVTYYLTENDAVGEVNEIENPEAYAITGAEQVIYALVRHSYIQVCQEIVSFTIRVSKEPVITLAKEAYICADDGELQLTANAGYDSYIWSTGQTTRFITVNEPGLYSVTVSKLYGDASCSTTVDINVLASGPAESIAFETIDWTDHDNSIIVKVTGGIGEFEYSLDNSTFQESPEFTNLDPGIFTVYVRDKAGCGTVTKQVALLNYPKFFTPNGDGHHETWRISFSRLEPKMMVYIYDRYGKLLNSFGSDGAGWDGTFNGHLLPSTDYWFVVNRQDGKVFKGHFSLIR
jgi:gliding motility-associated-like protein